MIWNGSPFVYFANKWRPQQASELVCNIDHSNLNYARCFTTQTVFLIHLCYKQHFSLICATNSISHSFVLQTAFFVNLCSTVYFHEYWPKFARPFQLVGQIHTVLQKGCHYSLWVGYMGGGDSSAVRAPDSWLKGRGFESLQEQQENFLLQGQLSVLTLISVSVPPLCYRSST